MKKLIIPVLLLLWYPVFSFAACPIDGDDSACIAEFQPFQPVNNSQIQPMQTQTTPADRRFVETPHTTRNINRTESDQSTRNFGPKNSDYSYNASCQFGNCGSNGTPKNISAED